MNIATEKKDEISLLPSSVREGGLSLSRMGAVAVVWLDRPEKLNAMNRMFWRGFRSLLEELADQDDLRAVIVTGRGRAFSAGGDIASFNAISTNEERILFQQDCMDTFAAVERFPLPLIAAVNGLALGGGCELAMTCDIVFCAESARFAMPEARLGLVPGYGILRAAEIMGRQWANWMMLTGEEVPASTAVTMGLAQKVVPDDDLLEETMRTAASIAALPSHVVGAVKKFMGSRTEPAAFSESVALVSSMHDTSAAAELRQAFAARSSVRASMGKPNS